MAYILTHGDPLPGMIVRHRCSDRACVNPAHLFLATEADRTTGRRGATVPGAKLTDADVREIRRLATTAQWTGRRLAARFGVSTATISMIVNRKVWRHLD